MSLTFLYLVQILKIYKFNQLQFLILFVAVVPWLYQYWPGGFMVFVVLCPGTPEGSTGSGSGFFNFHHSNEVESLIWQLTVINILVYFIKLIGE